MSTEEDGDSNFSNDVYVKDSASMVKPRRRFCCLRFSRDRFASIAPVAWMILFGDGFHNLMDGLTIGAGFTQSPIIGIALSLSILFEELPHELGRDSSQYPVVIDLPPFDDPRWL